MEFFRVLLFVLCISSCFFTPSQARTHKHKEHKHSHHHHPPSYISVPPSPAPEPSDPSNDGNSNNSSGVFDVRTYGAIGDGISDDTEAFKTAWDTACQVDSAVILVPHGHSFMIQSTIFTGPCQSGLVLQVINVHIFF